MCLNFALGHFMLSHNIINIFLGVLFDTVYEQHCRMSLPPAPLQSLIEISINRDEQQQYNQLYCGYCNQQCATPADLVKHCREDSHMYAVFADSGRDVFWQFEPPPADEEIASTALHR